MGDSVKLGKEELVVIGLLNTERGLEKVFSQTIVAVNAGKFGVWCGGADSEVPAVVGLRGIAGNVVTLTYVDFAIRLREQEYTLSIRPGDPATAWAAPKLFSWWLETLFFPKMDAAVAEKLFVQRGSRETSSLTSTAAAPTSTAGTLGAVDKNTVVLSSSSSSSSLSSFSPSELRPVRSVADTLKKANDELKLQENSDLQAKIATLEDQLSKKTTRVTDLGKTLKKKNEEIVTLTTQNKELLKLKLEQQPSSESQNKRDKKRQQVC